MAARITREETAPAYFPPLHEGVAARRLQGHEAGPTEAFWVGLSVYEPGGTAQRAPASTETVYVVLAGELELTVMNEDDGTPSRHTLKPYDSVHLPPGTVRSVENRTGEAATLLVTIAVPRAG